MKFLTIWNAKQVRESLKSSAVAFRKAIERFVDLPEAGPPRPALGQDIRIAIVFPYILIYEYLPQGDTVTLLRIVHGRRNITGKLLNRAGKP